MIRPAIEMAAADRQAVEIAAVATEDHGGGGTTASRRDGWIRSEVKKGARPATQH